MGNIKEEKSTFHPRNKHRNRYDFEALKKVEPALAPFISLNKYGNESIDFANPLAVKALNTALLKAFYGLTLWDIPDGYLCPPIPGRADYLHYAADLLASVNAQNIPQGKQIKVLDVGVGANCIYPIIGHREYGWSFIGSDIDENALKIASTIVEANQVLKKGVEFRFQANKLEIFNSIIHKEELFDLTICNPPFHASAAEAMAGSTRKVSNLGKGNAAKPVLNFGGQSNELWTKGGEMGFIEKMIQESAQFKNQCLWFSTLVSKSENLDSIYALLKRANVIETRTAELSTGNKLSRIVAWTFLDQAQQTAWVKRWKV